MRLNKVIEIPWLQIVLSTHWNLINKLMISYLLQNYWTLSLTMISFGKTHLHYIRYSSKKSVKSYSICSVYAADRHRTLCTPWFKWYTQSKEFPHCVFQFQLSLNIIAIIDSTLDLSEAMIMCDGFAHLSTRGVKITQ